MVRGPSLRSRQAQRGEAKGAYEQVFLSDFGPLRCQTHYKNKHGMDLLVGWRKRDRRWRPMFKHGPTGGVNLSRLHTMQPSFLDKQGVFYSVKRIVREDKEGNRVLIEWVGYPKVKDYTWQDKPEPGAELFESLRLQRTLQAVPEQALVRHFSIFTKNK